VGLTMYVLEYLVLCGASLRVLASLDKIGEDIEVGKMSSNQYVFSIASQSSGADRV